jgi:hypothetical protein
MSGPGLRDNQLHRSWDHVHIEFFGRISFRKARRNGVQVAITGRDLDILACLFLYYTFPDGYPFSSLCSHKQALCGLCWIISICTWETGRISAEEHVVTSSFLFKAYG